MWLAVDTALGACSVAAATAEGTVRATRWHAQRRGHSEILPPMAQAVLAEAGGAPTALATTVGPGYFTGLRVGLSYVRGRAVASGLPAVGVTTLAAVAADNAPHVPAGAAALLVALSTRRADYYVQLFSPDGRTPWSEPAALAASAVAEHVAAHGLAPASLARCGDAHAALAGDVPALAAAAPVDGPAGGLPHAATVARLAAAQGAAPDGAPPTPLYLRAPDVTPPR